MLVRITEYIEFLLRNEVIIPTSSKLPITWSCGDKYSMAGSSWETWIVSLPHVKSASEDRSMSISYCSSCLVGGISSVLTGRITSSSRWDLVSELEARFHVIPPGSINPIVRPVLVTLWQPISDQKITLGDLTCNHHDPMQKEKKWLQDNKMMRDDRMITDKKGLWQNV